MTMLNKADTKHIGRRDALKCVAASVTTAAAVTTASAGARRCSYPRRGGANLSGYVAGARSDLCADRRARPASRFLPSRRMRG